MDYMGILKESWGVTWRNRSLWILGLFAAAGADLWTGNFKSSSSSSGGSEGVPAWLASAHTPNEALQRGLDEAGRQLGVPMGTAEQWWGFIALTILTLIVICLVLWVIGIAARGGLIEQTREAVAGRPTSAVAGWRSGMRHWGRVFVVGFLLALPLLGLGILGLIALVAFGGIALVTGGQAAEPAAGLMGMGVTLGLIGLVAIAVSVVTNMLEEVALRHAVLDGRGAVDSIKAAWDDLRAKRGVASMWLVMLLVNVCAAIAAGILLVPVALVSVVVVGGAVYAGGSSMLWLAAPCVLLLILMGMLFKALFSTFLNTAWTSFYGRIERPESSPEASVPATPAAIA